MHCLVAIPKGLYSLNCFGHHHSSFILQTSFSFSRAWGEPWKLCKPKLEDDIVNRIIPDALSGIFMPP
jgi:hypothetical protein